MGVRGRNHSMIASLVVVLLVGFFCLLLVTIIGYRATRTAPTSVPSASDSDFFKLMGAKRHAVYYVSKRRVPNGPDPIHNRKTVMKYREPPGQA